MKNELVIPIHESVREDDVRRRIVNVGVKYLNVDEAEKLGLFKRMSILICAMHNLSTVMYKIYGQVEYLLRITHGDKSEIKYACNKFFKAYDEWLRFWRGYQTVSGVQEMNRESEDLYLQYMRWSCIPTEWELGDSQETEAETEPLIEIERGDDIWRMYKDVAEVTITEDGEEEWGVFLADRLNGSRILRCIERGMDKSSAKMSAKRLSANEKERMYVVGTIQPIIERRLDITPHNAFMDGDMVGDVKKVRKKK